MICRRTNNTKELSYWQLVLYENRFTIPSHDIRKLAVSSTDFTNPLMLLHSAPALWPLLTFNLEPLSSSADECFFLGLSGGSLSAESFCCQWRQCIQYLVQYTAANGGEVCSNIQKAKVKSSVKNNDKCPLQPLFVVFLVFYGSSMPCPFPVNSLPIPTHLSTNKQLTDIHHPHPVMCSCDFKVLNSCRFVVCEESFPFTVQMKNTYAHGHICGTIALHPQALVHLSVM